MAVNDRPTEQGAVAPPPTNDLYSPAGVFDSEGVTIAGQGGTSSSSIAESTLTPSGTGGGTGTEPNDTPITIMAGNGLAGGGNFTTNQAAASTITLDLPPVGMMGTFGTADMPVQSVSVDGFGRVTSITLQQDAPIPTPFRDNFSASADNTVRAAAEAPRMEDITISVADGYTVDTVVPMSTGTVPVTLGTPTGLGTDTVTIPVTIPATQQPSDPVGSVSVMTTSMVTETSSMRTREETATPLDTMTFIPFYQMVYDTRQDTVTLSGLTASEVALDNGTMVTLQYNTSGSRRQYGYLALEMEVGRTYRFDAGFFDISADPLPGVTATMFGRTYEFFEFPTQADLSFTIRW